MITRTYAEVIRKTTFEERFSYLKLNGSVGRETFGFDRYLNQRFYKSREWRDLRDLVIVRDNGCDLGVTGFDIHDNILVHHINPVTSENIKAFDEDSLLNPDYLILTTLKTHNAIHYGDDSLLPRVYVERKPNDTKLW